MQIKKTLGYEREGLLFLARLPATGLALHTGSDARRPMGRGGGGDFQKGLETHACPGPEPVAARGGRLRAPGQAGSGGGDSATPAPKVP